MDTAAAHHRHGLQAGTVSVWRIPLAQTAAAVEACRSLLTDDERRQADRYRVEPPRRRFTVTRAALRCLLGSVLGRPPGDVRLACGPHGKPYTPDVPWLHFNVSHSHEEALCAITTQGAVGVDIEHVRPLSDAAAIARTKFAPEEYAVWSSLPPDRQLEAFFACWSRKEAFIKATGEGLRRPLDDFIVTLHPDEPARLVTIRSTPDEAAGWTLLALPAPADYAAAVMVQGPMPEVVRQDWRSDGL